MGKRTKYLSLVFLIIAFTAGPVFCYFGYEPAVKAVAMIKGMGLPGVFLFTTIFILGTLVFLPLTLLTFAGGVLYGMAGGFAVGLAASTAGACLAFLISRYVCREWIQHKISQEGKFQAFSEKVKENDWKITLLSRFNLFLPYTGMNYAFGLTEISFFRYASASFVGLIPSTLLYVYLGTISGSIVAYFQGRKTFTPLETGMLIFAGAASVALVVYVFIMSRNLKTAK